MSATQPSSSQSLLSNPKSSPRRKLDGHVSVVEEGSQAARTSRSVPDPTTAGQDNGRKAEADLASLATHDFEVEDDVGVWMSGTPGERVDPRSEQSIGKHGCSNGSTDASVAVEEDWHRRSSTLCPSVHSREPESSSVWRQRCNNVGDLHAVWQPLVPSGHDASQQVSQRKEKRRDESDEAEQGASSVSWMQPLDGQPRTNHSTGQQFWGCSAFPVCSVTREGPVWPVDAQAMQRAQEITPQSEEAMVEISDEDM